MKTITFLIAIFFLFNLIACDNDNDNNETICTVEEFKENVANTDCLAEELILGCTNIHCSGINPTTSAGNLDENCTVIDCETLECERINITSENQTTPFPGIMMELTVDEITGFPIGIFQVDEIENEFSCGIIQS